MGDYDIDGGLLFLCIIGAAMVLLFLKFLVGRIYDWRKINKTDSNIKGENNKKKSKLIN